MYEDLLNFHKTRKLIKSKDNIDFYNYVVDKTTFLPEGVSSTQRLWHFYNNKFERPICIQCRQHVTDWDNTRTKSYRKFCSQECGYQYKRDHPTCIYGEAPECKAAGCTNRVKSMGPTGWRDTCSPKCGQLYIASLRVSYDEMMTFVHTHDPSLPMWQTIKPKNPAMFNTIMEYTSNSPTSFQITERVRWLRGELHSQAERLASLAQQQQDFLRQTPAPLCFNCKEQPCRASTVQRLRYNKYCSDKCDDAHKHSVAVHKLIQIIKRGKFGTARRPPHNKNNDPRLNSPEWLTDQHHNNGLKKSELAVMLGVDKETITNRFKEFNIDQIAWTKSVAEDKICNIIAEAYPQYTITRNSRSIIAPKELDIYIPELKLAIEYCGLYWHSSAHARITPTYHKNKLIKCQELGIRLITIFEDEWVHNPHLVTTKLLHIIGADQTARIYARKCKVVDVDKDTRKMFLNNYHIQGNGRGSKTIGLNDITSNQLVAVMTLYKDDKSNDWVLNRYATSCNVIGGFTKLLKHFTTHNTGNIITFADLRWSTGNLYEQTGFTLDSTLPPDYCYVDAVNKKRIHKFNFRRKFLKDKLKNFDPTKSETENCEHNGWHRIWHCGLKRYVLYVDSKSK